MLDGIALKMLALLNGSTSNSYLVGNYCRYKGEERQIYRFGINVSELYGRSDDFITRIPHIVDPLVHILNDLFILLLIKYIHLTKILRNLRSIRLLASCFGCLPHTLEVAHHCQLVWSL